jgi:NADPH:quinone reductase-like Zn-dependent oxidoreductase
MKNRKATITEFGSVNEIHIQNESELPKLKADEVLIKIASSTVSATDIIIRKGIYPLLKEKTPFTLGYDFVGNIEAIGSDVTKWNIGDRVADVCMTGGNADYIIRKGSSLLKVNEKIKAEQVACLVMTGMTAFQIFKSLNLKRGDSFLIHGGAGAIGTTLIQLCKLNNIRVVATCSTSKIDFINSQNIVAVDYTSPNYFQTLEVNAGNGFDAAIDFTNQRSFNQSYSLLKKSGKLITCAVFTSSKKIQKKTIANFLGFGLDFGLMMMKLAIWNLLPNGKSASFFGIVDSKKNNPNQFQKDFDELQQLVSTKLISPYIHQIFALDEITLAHQTLESGKAVGFVVIKN